jgi:hypothetical protein
MQRHGNGVEKGHMYPLEITTDKKVKNASFWQSGCH